MNAKLKCKTNFSIFLRNILENPTFLFNKRICCCLKVKEFKSQCLLNIKAVCIVPYSYVFPYCHQLLQYPPLPAVCQFIPALSPGISPALSHVIDSGLVPYTGVLPQGTVTASLILDLMLIAHFFCIILDTPNLLFVTCLAYQTL